MIAHIAKLHFASARFLLRPPTGENREYQGLSGNFLKKARQTKTYQWVMARIGKESRESSDEQGIFVRRLPAVSQYFHR
jgi:hypothetical protein